MRRKNRTRKRMIGTSAKPRLTVFRSNTRLSLQLIDDVHGTTLLSAHGKKGVAQAAELGKKIAVAAQESGIVAAIFDRGAYRYHGAIQAVAESVRKAGLKL